MGKEKMVCFFCKQPIGNDEPLASIVPLETPSGQVVYAHARHKGVADEYKHQGSPMTGETTEE